MHSAEPTYNLLSSADTDTTSTIQREYLARAASPAMGPVTFRLVISSFTPLGHAIDEVAPPTHAKEHSAQVQSLNRTEEQRAANMRTGRCIVRADRGCCIRYYVRFPRTRTKAITMYSFAIKYYFRFPVGPQKNKNILQKFSYPGTRMWMIVLPPPMILGSIPSVLPFHDFYVGFV